MGTTEPSKNRSIDNGDNKHKNNLLNKNFQVFDLNDKYKINNINIKLIFNE
jgi:hypothetical protein